MKIKAFIFLGLLLPITMYGQSIKRPMLSSSEDPSTVITEINTSGKYTVVSFKHTSYSAGAWVQLNKSMYLQDANGEDRYNYVRSEGIPLRPEKFVATKDNEEVNFKVYFEKLKPETKEINVIERARSVSELNDGVSFLNFYRVSLQNAQPEGMQQDNKTVQVTVTPPPPIGTYNVSEGVNEMANFGPMMSSMYTNMLNAQLKAYTDPEITTQLAKITKNYYDALIKAGFSADAALKIITSKPLVSMDGTK